MWWGATSGAAGGPEVVADDARVILTQTANPVFPPRNRKTVAVAVSTAQSDIIIHKVKTLAIDGGASGWTGSKIGAPDSNSPRREGEAGQGAMLPNLSSVRVAE